MQMIRQIKTASTGRSTAPAAPDITPDMLLIIPPVSTLTEEMGILTDASYEPLVNSLLDVESYILYKMLPVPQSHIKLHDMDEMSHTSDALRSV